MAKLAQAKFQPNTHQRATEMQLKYGWRSFDYMLNVLMDNFESVEREVMAKATKRAKRK
jgi:hypothetical protein